MANHWWQPLAQHAIWLVVMTLVMGWLAKSRLKPRARSKPGEMHYPLSVLIIGLICVVFFVAIAVLSRTFPGKNDPRFVSLFFVAFACLGLPLILEYFRVKFRLEPDGLRYQTLFGRRGVLPWNQIREIRFSPAAKWFRLDGQQGETIRVSVMMTTLPQLAQVLLQMATHAKIDAQTRELLEATAAGDPPSVWG